MILPTNLIARLSEQRLWPGSDISLEALSEYWEHARAHGQAWAKNVPNNTHPLYIWADDAQYNERGSKLVIIVLGHVLDQCTDSTRACFPIACLRYEPGLNFSTNS